MNRLRTWLVLIVMLLAVAIASGEMCYATPEVFRRRLGLAA